MNILAGKKTLIFNILTLAVVILSGQFGFDAPWLHSKAAIETLAVANVLLRLVTKSPDWLTETIFGVEK